MKILMTGGSGTLGSELIKIASAAGHDIISPAHISMPVESYPALKIYLESNKPDIFLHCAAAIDVAAIEINPLSAIQVNVVGTANVVRACAEAKTKLVYISTDYVFDGVKGLYKTQDPLNPLSKYAKTKTAAELVVRTYDNSLIIRTSFFGRTFPYPKAFVDQWSSKDYVDIIAPKILEAIEDNKIGIVHIGSPRRSLYDIAITRNPDVKQASVHDLGHEVPIDTSFSIEESLRNL